VLSCSEVTASQCLLIKGLTYSLPELLFSDLIDLKGETIHSFLKRKDSNKIYQIVIYLAPGNYHRFHSPADIKILKTLSIPGRCDAVNERSLLSGHCKYEKNGRVSLFSEWKEGLLTMVMVGALNVTRIHLAGCQSAQQGQ
jgi:phosphatidylserine decarboxylase